MIGGVPGVSGLFRASINTGANLSKPMTEIKLSDLDSKLKEFDYPVSRQELISGSTEVTLLLADGEKRLEEVLDGLSSDTFESVDDLESEIYANLPTEAIGEPGQSEGDA